MNNPQPQNQNSQNPQQYQQPSNLPPQGNQPTYPPPQNNQPPQYQQQPPQGNQPPQYQPNYPPQYQQPTYPPPQNNQPTYPQYQPNYPPQYQQPTYPQQYQQPYNNQEKKSISNLKVLGVVLNLFLVGLGTIIVGKSRNGFLQLGIAILSIVFMKSFPNLTFIFAIIYFLNLAWAMYSVISM